MPGQFQDNRKPVTPDERQALLPLPPVASSAALGWPGLRVEHYRGEADLVGVTPRRFRTDARAC